jgi:hypothetical protein
MPLDNKGCWTTWAWRHSSNKSAPCWVAEKLQPYSLEKIWRGLWPRALHGVGGLTPLLCYLFVNKVMEGLNGNGCYTLVYVLCSSAENSHCLRVSSGGDEYSTTVVWYKLIEISYTPKKVQQQDQNFMKPGH